MEKTTKIYESKSSTKFNEYVQLARELHTDSQETADSISDELMVRCAIESEQALRRAINADCEYTAYVNCLEVEAWNNRIAERLENL